MDSERCGPRRHIKNSNGDSNFNIYKTKTVATEVNTCTFEAKEQFCYPSIKYFINQRATLFSIK
jgi:hypothetical protein